MGNTHFHWKFPFALPHMLVRKCKIGSNSTQKAILVLRLFPKKNSHKRRKSMALDIFQLLCLDVGCNASETVETAGNLLEIPVSWSFCLHSRSYFQGNFQKPKTSKGVIFPGELLEMCIRANPWPAHQRGWL